MDMESKAYCLNIQNQCKHPVEMNQIEVIPTLFVYVVCVWMGIKIRQEVHYAFVWTNFDVYASKLNNRDLRTASNVFADQ